MKDPTAAVRLRETQNADGGWGYFPGKQSWLEPTAYAAMALAGEPAAERAWTLLKSWQTPDGGWRPSAEVQIPSWGASLCVTLAQARGELGEPFQKGVAWLLSSAGNRPALWVRLLAHAGVAAGNGRNRDLMGWPWKPDTYSWVEPTSHAIVALKQASSRISSKKLQERLRDGQAQLLDVRCSDGGWNYGSSAALEVDLVAFPETTGLALIGLQNSPGLEKSLALAAKMARETTSPLARAWLTIALRLHDAEVPPSAVAVVSTPETTVTALSIIAEDKPQIFRTGGNHMSPNRREFLAVAGASVFAGFAGFEGATPKRQPPQTSSPVSVIKAKSYADDLVSRILEGVKQCGLDVRGQRVLLKPNLVEFDPKTCINTDVTVVAAALEAFRSLGASEVKIGEGPGHRRDTYAIAEMTRYRSDIPKFDALFTDLNRDDVSPVQRFATRSEIYLPNTALRADLIVSLAKMKTHHWAGATLSMKNFFGVVPGSIYGWPKNELHNINGGNNDDIETSIVELNRIFRRTFAIVDGIVGMEGNGPIQGTPKPAGVLVMGSDLPAVDATCCRIMGIDPLRIKYLSMAYERALGLIEEAHIEQRGETIKSVATKFELIEKFKGLRLLS